MSEDAGGAESVFPARAGMSRTTDHVRNLLPRFPRTRGDEPGFMSVDEIRALFSPHARG